MRRRFLQMTDYSAIVMNHNTIWPYKLTTSESVEAAAKDRDPK